MVSLVKIEVFMKIFEIECNVVENIVTLVKI